jgi:L-amino acid N-acyltransferase YncA
MTDTIEFVEAAESDLTPLLELYNYYLLKTTTTFDYDGINIDEFKSRISFNRKKYKTFLIRQKGAPRYCRKRRMNETGFN